MKFSVIVPAYNEEEYIQECLESLLEQSHKEFEIIVVNDGSTDRTGEIISGIISGMERKSRKIRLLDKTINEGQMVAINDAAFLADGDIICLFGGDMKVTSDYLKRAAKWFSDPLVVLAGGLEKPLNKGILVSGAGFLDSFMQPKEVKKDVFVNGGGMCIRKSVYDRIGGHNPDDIWSEDMSINIRIKEYCDKHGCTTIRDPKMVYYTQYPPEPYKMLKRHFLWGYGRAQAIKRYGHLTAGMLGRIAYLPAFIISLFMVGTFWHPEAALIIGFPIIYVTYEAMKNRDIPEDVLVIISGYLVAYIRLIGSSAGSIYGLLTKPKRLKTYGK